MSKLTELKAAFAKMGAEIEKLESEPKSIWQPKEGEAYYWLNSDGAIRNTEFCVFGRITYHNVYQTANQAEKASFLTRQSNRIIQACINFDPDFLPDWTDGSLKYSVWYRHGTNYWEVTSVKKVDSCPAYVSTNEIARSICDLFNEEGEA